MQKIKILTDSASDISKEDEIALNIKVMGFPITVGNEGYRERTSFNNSEFYDIMDNSQEFPTTAQITMFELIEVYKEIYKAGYTDIIQVTISSTGSNTYSAALMAKDDFFREVPEAAGKFNIAIIDSLNYTATYGYPVTQAAIKADKGASVEEIVSYLNDWFSCGELIFGAYSLEYVKRSGRLSCAAAFVGEVLGLRPILKVIDGKSITAEKVRGDKNIIPKIMECAIESMIPQTPYVIITGSIPEYSDELTSLMTKKLGYPPENLFQVGAAVACNAGHKIVGIVVKGNKRK